ncbi:MAG: hypothetical protein HYS12_05865 [Planctomycetes bacterium]|nr:hypothetical protein [Planctomycetota bacterium]
MPPAVRLLRPVARGLLGLFVLWQMIFLPAFNLLDGAEAARRDLREQRRQDGRWWRLLRTVPRLEPLVDEWLTKGANYGDKGKLGNLIERPRRVVRWWAQATGQEQGWKLFAPDTFDFSAFPSLELRWDDPEAEDGTGLGALAGGAALALCRAPPHRVAHEPLVLGSDNQPADRRCYLRFGGFRRRRIEAQFELDFRRDGRPREQLAELWEQQIRNLVSADYAETLAFLRWRLTRFHREHPELPPPVQVILRVQTFVIPAPPGPRPWDWIEEEAVPLARWLPQKQPSELEFYYPTADRFRKD